MTVHDTAPIGVEAPTLDSRAFRAALSSFATGVTVVTARGPDGAPVGVTVNSFSSVSLDPPLVLWSLDRRALSLPVFEAAGHFAVHVLSAEQAHLSDRFATRGASDKFEGVDWSEGIGGVPLLPGIAARFECRRHAAHDGGDHRIYLGRVLRFENNGDATLAFQRGAYAICDTLERVSRRAISAVNAASTRFDDRLSSGAALRA